MESWKPFYDYGYARMQIKVVEWLFMMFAYNEINPELFNVYFGERVKMFANSQNRRLAEQENGSALNKTPRQLFCSVLNILPTYDIEHHRDSLAAWTGDIFVMLNWKYGIPCVELAELDWNKIYQLGEVLHEASCVNACEKIINKYGLVPRGCDERMRF